MTTAFHVSQGGLGPAVDLTVNDAWGEHSRKQALVTAAIIDKHLSDGREWIIGGKEPTAADITLCTAMASGKSDDFKLVRNNTVTRGRPFYVVELTWCVCISRSAGPYTPLRVPGRTLAEMD